VIVDRDEYVLFYAPHTGIGVMRSADMMTWRDCGVMTLGVEAWDWAKGRPARGQSTALLPRLALGREGSAQGIRQLDKHRTRLERRFA